MALATGYRNNHPPLCLAKRTIFLFFCCSVPCLRNCLRCCIRLHFETCLQPMQKNAKGANMTMLFEWKETNKHGITRKDANKQKQTKKGEQTCKTKSNQPESSFESDKKNQCSAHKCSFRKQFIPIGTGTCVVLNTKICFCKDTIDIILRFAGPDCPKQHGWIQNGVTAMRNSFIGESKGQARGMFEDVKPPKNYDFSCVESDVMKINSANGDIVHKKLEWKVNVDWDSRKCTEQEYADSLSKNFKKRLRSQKHHEHWQLQ